MVPCALIGNKCNCLLFILRPNVHVIGPVLSELRRTYRVDHESPIASWSTMVEFTRYRVMIAGTIHFHAS
jgi:hypothetical protein